MAAPDPFAEIGTAVLNVSPVTLPLFADARFCVLTDDEPRGLQRALEARRNSRPKHAAALAYRWLLTQALAGRPFSPDDLAAGGLHLHLDLEVFVSRRMSAELAAISANDPVRHPAEHTAEMVNVSRATIFNWRAEPSFEREVSRWRKFFRDNPDAEFPLDWVYAQRLLDATGEAPETIVRRAHGALLTDATELGARVVIHDSAYWYANVQLPAPQALLVALGCALGMIDATSGRPDLCALWGIRYPAILRDEAQADGLSLRSSGRLRSGRELKSDERRKFVGRLRTMPAYRLIMKEAAV